MSGEYSPYSRYVNDALSEEALNEVVNDKSYYEVDTNDFIELYRNIGYQDVNDYLRTGRIGSYDEPTDGPIQYAQNIINEMNKHMKRIDMDYPLYRGIQGCIEKYANLEVGQELSDNAFFSTSRNYGTALTFTGVEQDGILFEVTSSKGLWGNIHRFARA